MNKVQNFDYGRYNEFYSKFEGKTIESVVQTDNEKIAFKFTDGTIIYVYNNGIQNEDIHLKIREL